MIQLETLPRFPCWPNKKPQTRRGFLDARLHKSDLGWPLVGIPTGERVGFDILDIDVRGIAWFNEMPIPATRHQWTRSGGLHIFFRHAPGLRCSSGKIADGVDHRADGGYVIDWHREGLPVAWPDLLAEWPGWLLERARGAVRPMRTSACAREHVGADDTGIDDIIGSARARSSAMSAQALGHHYHNPPVTLRLVLDITLIGSNVRASRDERRCCSRSLASLEK